MKLYLDDDTLHKVLVQLLRREGHDVQLPADVALAGEKDPVHFLHAARDQRVVLSQNHDDFKRLHELVIGTGGHHQGVLIFRKDNDPRRDMKPPHIVRAIRNLTAAQAPVTDQFIILNHWR